jgi:LmbE family N-acetylglucosaminyl deacetylase
MLPYVDQQLGRAQPDEVRRWIVQAIRRARPEIVVTFDPNGGNQHTDHVAISRFASDGVAAAADPRWYPDTGAAHSVQRLLWPSPLHVFDLGRTADLGGQPGIDFLIDIVPFRRKKEAALRAHRTQWSGLRKIFIENGRPEVALCYEAFRIAWGPRPRTKPADDLFST